MTVDDRTVLLRAREAELSAIYEHVPGIVFYIAVEPNGEFRFLSVSHDFLVVTGLSRQQVVGSLVRDVIPPSSRDMVLKHYLEAIRSGQTVRWEEESVYPAGRRYSEVAVTPLHDGSGSATHLIGMVHDLTERKRMERERTDEDRRKDEFLSLLGHELRNPLAAVTAALQLLSGGVTDEERISLNGMMDRQLKLMQRLLDDLLDLSRIKYGYIQLKKEPVDLASFLQHVTGVTRPMRLERGQEMILRFPNQRVRFMADEARLEQIAINLLSNASKYTAQGGTIELSGSREDFEVNLRCKDNGRGIPLEMQQKIFEPFTRGEPPTASRGEASLGIGLALVKQLVELHGGHISVESGGPGKGSEFSVRLPMEPVPSDQLSAPETKPASALRRSHSIVFVEDNPDVALPIVVALEQAGYRVVLFADAFSALAGLSDLQPHAILLDIGLPRMDGYELAAKLRKERDFRHGLIIAISGYKRRQTAEAADDFDHYFTKPVNLSSLLGVLGSRLDEAEEATAATTRPAPAPRVLVIDDHADLAAAMVKLLNREGLEVRAAFSGEEGIRLASDFRPQLVLCDLNLPDMSGFEVIRRIRSNPVTRTPYSVILTAQPEAEIRAFNDKAKELGVDEFISKLHMADVVHSLVAKLSPQAVSSKLKLDNPEVGHSTFG
jgi:PAS domain S-box-containing protein